MRGDGTPCYRFAVGICEQSDWNTAFDAIPNRRFFARFACEIFLILVDSPSHAPAVVWTALAFEELFKIAPAFCGYGMELQYHF